MAETTGFSFIALHPDVSASAMTIITPACRADIPSHFLLRSCTNNLGAANANSS